MRIGELRVERGATSPEVLATLTGSAAIAPGAPIEIDLRPAFAGGGTGVLDATVTSLIDAAGAIDANAATVELTLNLQGVPSELVQGFVGDAADLGALLGERFNTDASANGTLETMDASASIESAGVNGGVTVNVRDGVATRTGDSVIRVSGERAAQAIPALRRMLVEGDSIEFETWPDATLVISQLVVPTEDLSAGSLTGVSAAVRLETTPARARVPLSGSTGQTGVMDLSEMVLSAETTDLNQGLSLGGGASVRLDGRDAGRIDIKSLKTGDLLDDRGALVDLMTVGLTGVVSVDGLAAETIQPFVDGLGVDVAQELGPVLSANLRAAREGGADATDLTLSVEGERVTLQARTQLDGSTVRGAPGAKALSVTLRDPSRTLTRLLATSGVQIERASGVVLVVDTFEADLDAFSGDSPDLSGVRAQGVLRVPALVGRMDRDGESTSLVLSGLQLRFEAPESLASLSAEGLMQLGVDDQPPVAMNASLSATDLLAKDGSVDIWGATISASVLAPKVPSAMINVFAPEQFDATQDLGQMVSVDAGVSKASGQETPAMIDLKLESDRLTLNGAFVAEKTGVRTREEGLTLHSTGLAGIIERLAPLPEGMSVTREAKGVARITGLDVPLREGSPVLEDVVFDASVRITQFGVRSTEGTKPRANAKPIELSIARAAGADATFQVSTEGVTLKSLSLGPDESGTVRVAPPSVLAFNAEGTAPWAGLVGDEGSDVAFSLTGSLTDDSGETLAGLSGGGSVRAPDLSRLNVNVAAELTSSARTQEALALGDLLTGLFGPNATVTASLASDDFDTEAPLSGSRIGLEVDSPRMKTTSPVRLVGDDASLRLEQASGLRWRVDPAWATARMSGSGEPAFTLSRAVDLELDLQRLVVPQDGSGRLDVQLGATSSDIGIQMADGTQVEYEGLDASAKTTETPGVLAINATMKNRGGGDDALSAELTVEGLDSKEERASASGLIVITALPSSVADALVGGEGKLAMLLGETADVRTRLVDFPREGGTAKGSIKGLNATATFDGRVENGTFIASKPAVLNVRRIDNEFGFELAKIIPVFGGITKDPSVHPPGKVIVSPLRIPVDGRDVLEFASATIKVDPGEANLQLDGGLGGFLNLGGQGQTVGRRLEPFNVRFEKGVASYSDVKIPLGEFQLVARGNVNLIQQTQDVRVALPVGALASEVAGGGGIGRIFDATGGVSLANKGKIGESGWELKLGGGGGKPDPASILEGILDGRP